MGRARVLTDADFRKEKPGERRRFVADSTPGLFLKIETSGAATWIWKGRPAPGAAPVSKTFGRYPGVTLQKARAEAAEINRLRDQGISFVAVKKAAAVAEAVKQGDTVLSRWNEYMDKEGRPKNSTSTAKEKQRLFDVEFADWHALSIHDITRAMLREKLDAKAWQEVPTTAAERKANPERLLKDIPLHPTMANRTLAHMRRFSNWLVENDVLTSSFAANIKQPGTEKPRQRVLTDDEIRWFFSATESLAPAWRAVWRLALFCGLRREEILEMDWDEVKLDGSLPVISLEGERTKNGDYHVIPLSIRAIAELKALCPKSTDGNGTKPKAGLVFPANRVGSDKAASGVTKINNRLLKAIAELAEVDIERFTLHDLRRTFGTRAAMAKVPAEVREALLNHTTGVNSGVARVYNQFDYLDEKVEAVSAWDANLSRILEKQPGDIRYNHT